MLQPPQPNKTNESGFVISYLNLRKAVGILGIALPVVLFSGFLLLDKDCKLPPSISHYYYTNFGTYFTGTLCAVALFLFSYKGPESTDEKAAMLASACALGVAFCPTNAYKDIVGDCIRVSIPANAVRNAFHYGFAALLFLTLAYFSLVLFTKTTEQGPTPAKRIRNKIYKICGWTIIGCVAGILLTTLMDYLHMAAPKKLDISTFILEAIALFAFGYSWLIKGETFFKDE
jgi:hypothetical protein